MWAWIIGSTPFVLTGARVLKGDPRYGKVVKPSEDFIGWLFGKGE